MKTIIEMAQSVGAVDQDLLDRHTEYVVFTKSQLEAFAELVRADAIADEREACAKVCDDWAKTSYLSEAKSCAKIIRARSNT